VDHASRGGSADSSRFATGGSSFGWSFSFNNVFTDTTLKPDDLYVTAYYPGRPVTTHDAHLHATDRRQAEPLHVTSPTTNRR
jgi:hypothetical protein